MRRAARVIATTPATTPSITAVIARSERSETAPVLRKPNASRIPGRKRSTIEKKIRREAPLPRPRSVICSPSHITKSAPVVRKSTIWSVNAVPGRTTAPCTPAVKSAYPYPCTAARPTVA